MDSNAARNVRKGVRMLARKSTDVTMNVNTIIGEGTVFVGDLTAKDTTRVDGEIKGNIKSEGAVVIGTGGRIEGNIYAETVKVGGNVKGDIHADNKVEASATARIFGNISARVLVVDENAVFQGSCNMGESAQGSFGSDIKGIAAAEDE